MGYVGNTLVIPLDNVGLNGSPSIDRIPPESMVHPSRNVNLHEGGIGKRGGTAYVDSAAMSGTPRIVGIFDYRLIAGTQFILRATGDGKIYKNATSTIKTGLGTNKIADFVYYNNEVYHCNGNDIPQVWDGAAGTTSNLALVPTDWAGTNYPKQMVKHGRGNSERLWAFGAPLNPNNVYISKSNDGSSEADFSDANGQVIYIGTDDGTGIVGGIEFQDRLFAFAKQRTYIIDDLDLNTTNWGYAAAAWDGGAATHRLIVRTPNDIVCMMEDGEIYSVLAAQQYGDYRQASLTRPAFIHNWIKEHVDLSYIESFHAKYDPVLRAVRFWIVKQGSITVNANMVYFVDKSPDKAWSIHDNQSFDSGYSAVSANLIRVGTGDYQIYSGDYSGRLWTLEQETRSDNGQGYWAGFKLPQLNFGNARSTKHINEGRIVALQQGNYNLNINIKVDGTDSITDAINLGGVGGLIGSFVLGTDKLGGNRILDKGYDIKMLGKRMQVEYYNSSAGQDFFVSQVMFDFKDLGVLP